MKEFCSQGGRHAPLFDAICSHIQKAYIPFHVPGHTCGRGADEEFRSFVGGGLFLVDVTELPGLDNLLAPEGPIRKAQELAGSLYGADRSYFLVNGSSVGILSMVASAIGAGENIILPRDSHVSAVGALVISGAIPIWVVPRIQKEFGLPLGPEAGDISRAIEAYPEARALLITRPNYYGVVPDLKTIAATARDYDKIVMVDEAHGGHWEFHEGLPEGALHLGADLVVQSLHKTGGSLTQTAILHVKGDRVKTVRLEGILRLLQTTSPSYVLLASLDTARRQLATKGREMISRMLELASYMRRELSRCPWVRCLEKEDVVSAGAYEGIDPTRLVVNISGLGLTGAEVEVRLREGYGVAVEFSDMANVVVVLGLGNAQGDAEALVRAFSSLRPSGVKTCSAVAWGSLLEALLSPEEQVMPPREAFLGNEEALDFEAAIRRVSADAVITYPPGIATIWPGERISPDKVSAIRCAQNAGVRVFSLSTGSSLLRVVAGRRKW